MLPCVEALANRSWKEVEVERLGKMGTSLFVVCIQTHFMGSFVPHTENWTLNFISNNLKVGLVLR